MFMNTSAYGEGFTLYRSPINEIWSFSHRINSLLSDLFSINGNSWISFSESRREQLVRSISLSLLPLRLVSADCISWINYELWNISSIKWNSIVFHLWEDFFWVFWEDFLTVSEIDSINSPILNLIPKNRKFYIRINWKTIDLWVNSIWVCRDNSWYYIYPAWNEIPEDLLNLLSGFFIESSSHPRYENKNLSDYITLKKTNILYIRLDHTWNITQVMTSDWKKFLPVSQSV